MNRGAAVLALLPPWLIALPLGAVRRLLAAEDAPEAVPAVGGVPALRRGPDGPLAVWDLAGLLHLAAPPAPALAVLDLPGPAMALGIGRCLGVAEVAEAVDLPAAALREPLPLACFAAGPLAARHGAAAVGLWLDPRRLLGPDRLHSARVALAAWPERAA